MNNNKHNAMPDSTFAQYMTILFMPTAVVTVCAGLEMLAHLIGL